MRILGLPLVLLLLAGGAVSAAEPNTLTPKEQAAGWQLLFDGSTFAGWQTYSPPTDAWVIEDGTLKTVPGAKIRDDLVTEATFTDFEMVFEWRISEAGHSGVKYRVQDQAVLQRGRENPDLRTFEDRVADQLASRRGVRNEFDPKQGGEVYNIGFEYQLIDNERHPDALRGEDRTTGALYSIQGPTTDATRPPGEFNQSRIVVRGNRVEHWLNGVRVLEFDLKSPQVGEGLAGRWGAGSEVYRLLTEQPKRACPVVLQFHGDEVWFRNIKIRPL